MAGSFVGGFVGAERDPSLAFLARARPAQERDRVTAERPIEARVRTLQATAGNAAVGQTLQRQAAGAVGPGGDTGAPTRSLLKYGDRGDAVRDLQARLNEARAAKPQLVIDGIFGRKTQAAVRRFQETHTPIGVDGDAGPETWSALEKARTEPAADPGADAPAADPFAAGKEHYEARRYGRATTSSRRHTRSRETLRCSSTAPRRCDCWAAAAQRRSISMRQSSPPISRRTGRR